jgi:predicted secreted Zn-dependent protease
MCSMAEAPDFEQIAAVTLMAVRYLPVPERVRAVNEQLRLIWNARGAADIAQVEQELSTTMGSAMARAYLTNLERALRGLDK